MNNYNDIDQLIFFKVRDRWCSLPPFKKETLYKGMEVNKNYKLEELGLWNTKTQVTVEAIKYDKEHIGKALSFCGVLDYNPHDNEYYVKTLEGHMKVSDGDYIIKGVQGEYYPCKPDIFEQTYEVVEWTIL